ncbi:hypothetical protein [Corynebacterium rhinophilum]|uniref:hypothetical protein n=1 Tax=Corynebacterium rhinophilum TaxID=3050197 RepID=UPI00254BE4DE|nr:hypothetical protein [Corynebacterium sp. MSK192]MDK8699091.1 hypothetical protein [Corynebacterium sp. MSK192]
MVALFVSAGLDYLSGLDLPMGGVLVALCGRWALFWACFGLVVAFDGRVAALYPSVFVTAVAGINGGATLLAFLVGPVGVLLVLPRVVDECAEQAGAFGGWAAVELLGAGVDGGVADSGLASSARSARKLVEGDSASLARCPLITVTWLAISTPSKGRVGPGRAGSL